MFRGLSNLRLNVLEAINAHPFNPPGFRHCREVRIFEFGTEIEEAGRLSSSSIIPSAPLLNTTSLIGCKTIQSVYAMIFCFCWPNLSTPRVTTSPGFSQIGSGFIPSATPGGVPVVMTSPGSSSKNCEQYQTIC